MDSVAETITERVLEGLVTQFSTLISSVLSAAFGEVIPNVVERIVTSICQTFVPEVTEEEQSENRPAPPPRYQLEDLRSDLRAGEIDAELLCHIHLTRESWKETHLGSLLENVANFREIAKKFAVTCTYCRNMRAPEDLKRKEYPNRVIVDYLARLGLEEELSAYLSRFPTPHTEMTARAYEALQVSSFNDSLNKSVGSRSGIRPENRLGFFRLAQRIRNEHGFTRENSPPNCFNSFEDIVELEREIEGGDSLNFMLQCIDLKLVRRQHLEDMYARTSNFSELSALHDKEAQFVGDTARDAAAFFYAVRFERLASQRPDLRPTWPEKRRYLKKAGFIGHPPRILFDHDIPDDRLDEALNCMLNYLLRAQRSNTLELRVIADQTVPLLRQLFRRGASLFYKDTDGGRSSLGALVELANTMYFEFPFEEFSEHICCPLTQRSYEVTFDVHRLASLSCLAARRVPHAGVNSRLPSRVSLFIELHQELTSQIEEGPSRRSPTTIFGFSSSETESLEEDSEDQHSINSDYFHEDLDL